MSLLDGYLLDRAHDLEARGVDASRICLDPGVGFGKSTEDNIVVLRATERLANLGYPLMCAVSRKPQRATTRPWGISLAAATCGARVPRVHDVPGMTQALDSFWASSEPWSCTVTVTLFPAREVTDEQVTAVVDAMPLSRQSLENR